MLLLKQWAAFRGALIALAVVVLLASFAVTAWPRAVTGLLTTDVQYRVAQPSAAITAVQTSVHANATDPSGVGGGGWVWEVFGHTLERTHDRMPSPLRAALQKPEWTARTGGLAMTGPRPATQYELHLEAFEQWRDEAILVDGTWPAPYDPQLMPTQQDGGDLTVPTPMVATSTPIEIAATAESAKVLSLELGQTRDILIGASAQPVKLVGIIAPRDPDAAYWQLQYLRAHPTDVNLGDAGSKITATAWIDPAPWAEMQYSFTSDTIGWFAADAAGVTWGNLPTVRHQLAAFLSSSPAGTDNWVQLHYTTGLDDLLAGIASAGSSLQTLLILLATGPLGAAIAVLVLGSELLVERRRAVLTLLSARGASGWWIRSRMALEGLVAGIPAAIVGLVVALLVTPGAMDAAALVGAASCAVLPAAILAILARPAERVSHRRRRWRWVLEVLVLAATAVAIVTLIERGVSPGGVDPLLVLTPLLVTLSAAVVVLRVYPLPLRALHGALRRRRGAIGLIGAARSVLGIRSALIPVLVVLTGVAMAVFSAIALESERGGITQAAHAQAGADVSLGGSGLSAKGLSAVKTVPGVTGIGRVDTAGFAGASHDGGSEFVEVLVADTARLARLQSALPPGARVPDLSHKVGGRIPIAIGSWQNAQAVGDVTLAIDAGDANAIVVSTTASLGAAAPNSAWVLVDRALVPDGLDAPTLRGALVALDGAHQSGKDAATAASAIVAAAGPAVTTESAAARADAIRSAPAVSGVETALLVASVLGAILAVVALVLTLVMGARERLRLVGTLRTLGFDRRQTTGLVAWEVSPILASGLVGGVIAGIALPFAVLAPLDLSAFTGGAQPPIPIDPLLITAVVAVFVIVVAAVVALAVWISSRRSPAQVLRVGEEE